MIMSLIYGDDNEHRITMNMCVCIYIYIYNLSMCLDYHAFFTRTTELDALWDVVSAVLSINELRLINWPTEKSH
jgi:hypothetical protein